MQCHYCYEESDEELNLDGRCMECAAKRPVPSEELEVIIECPVETTATVRVKVSHPITATDADVQAAIAAKVKEIQDVGDDSLRFEIDDSGFNADFDYHLARLSDDQDWGSENGCEHEMAAWYRKAHKVEKPEEPDPNQRKLF